MLYDLNTNSNFLNYKHQIINNNNNNNNNIMNKINNKYNNMNRK